MTSPPPCCTCLQRASREERPKPSDRRRRPPLQHQVPLPDPPREPPPPSESTLYYSRLQQSTDYRLCTGGGGGASGRGRVRTSSEVDLSRWRPLPGLALDWKRETTTPSDIGVVHPVFFSDGYSEHGRECGCISVVCVAKCRTESRSERGTKRHPNE